MANKVEISIETDLGDTLLKLRAVRDAIKDIHDKTVEVRVESDRTRGFGMTNVLQDTETAARDTANALESVAQATQDVSDRNEEVSVTYEKHRSWLNRIAGAAGYTDRALGKLGGTLDRISLGINKKMTGRVLGPLGLLLSAPFELLGAGLGAGEKLGGLFGVGGQAAGPVGGLASIFGVGGGAEATGATAAFGEMAATIGPLIGLVGGLAASFAALFAIITAGILIWNVFIALLNTVADTIGALLAIAIAAAGPLGVFVAVLGGLGVAAMLGFRNAMASSGPQFHAFRSEVDHLKEGFVTLTKQLAVDFMPWFMSLGKVANNVLGYFEHLAKVAGSGGLQAVFKSLTSGGFARLNMDFLKVIGPIGNVIAQIIKFAFGRGGAEGEQILTADFHRFINWIQTAGNPIKKWFNNQQFGNVGKDLAHDVIDSPAVRSAIVKVADFLWKTFKSELERALGPKRWQELMNALNSIKTTAQQIATIVNTISTIFGKLGGSSTVFWLTMEAISLAAQAISSALSALAAPIETAISAAKTLLGILEKIASVIPGGSFTSGSDNNLGHRTAGHGGAVPHHAPRAGIAGAHSSLMGNTTIVIHNASLSTPAQERATAARIASLLNSRRIGGGF